MKEFTTNLFQIGRVCKGKRKSTGGFIWSYSKVI